MRNWYKCEFRTGGFCITSLKSPVLLDLSHVLDVSWSISGLIVRDKVPECEVRYADGTTLFLDNPNVILPWEMLEKGSTEFVINDKVKAECVVHKMSSFDDWDIYKQDLPLSDSVSFDIWVKMMLLLKEPSIDVIESDIEWLADQMESGNISDESGKYILEYFKNTRRDLLYGDLFRREVYDRLPREQRRQVRNSVFFAYDDVMSMDREP